MEKVLVEIFENILEIKNVGIEDNFFDLGVNSIKAIQIVSRIKRLLNIDIKLNEIFEYPTISSLVDNQLHNKNIFRSAIRLNNKKYKKDIFCIHGGGGAISGFKTLAENLKDHNFYGLQASGLAGEEYLHKSIDEMVNGYLKEIREIKRNGPYILMGYSFGSYVAYEIAQILYLQGVKVEKLIILDTPPFNKESSFNPDEKIHEIALEIASGAGINIECVKHIEVEDMLKYIYENEAYRNLEPFNQISYTQANNIKSVIKANLNINNKLQMKKNENLFDTDIYYIKAENSKSNGEWNAWTRGQVNNFEVVGDHASILKEPDVFKLSEIINEILE